MCGDERTKFNDSLGGSEQLGAVGGQAIDGTVMAPDLAEGRQWVGVPEAQQASSATAEQHRGARDHAQSADPVCLSTGTLSEREEFTQCVWSYWYLV